MSEGLGKLIIEFKSEDKSDNFERKLAKVKKTIENFIRNSYFRSEEEIQDILKREGIIS